jgi:hypothetical protein
LNAALLAVYLDAREGRRAQPTTFSRAKVRPQLREPIDVRGVERASHFFRRLISRGDRPIAFS